MSELTFLAPLYTPHRRGGHPDLVKIFGLMNISKDPRAPVKPGAGDLEKHQGYPLQLENDNLLATQNTQCESIKAVKISQPGVK